MWLLNGSRSPKLQIQFGYQYHHTTFQWSNLNSIFNCSETGELFLSETGLGSVRRKEHMLVYRSRSESGITIFRLVWCRQVLEILVHVCFLHFTFFVTFFATVLSQWDFAHRKFGLPSMGKTSCDRAALPNLQCMLGVLVFSYDNPPKLWHGIWDL